MASCYLILPTEWIEQDNLLRLADIRLTFITVDCCNVKERSDCRFKCHSSFRAMFQLFYLLSIILNERPRLQFIIDPSKRFFKLALLHTVPLVQGFALIADCLGPFVHQNHMTEDQRVS